MKVPQLKAIGARLGLPKATGLSHDEWIRLIRDTNKLEFDDDDDNNAEIEYGVYVRNLPPSFNWMNLKDTFSRAFKDVVYADIGMHRGRSAGWGTVRFASEESRDNAIKRFNGTKIVRHKIRVTPDKRIDKRIARRGVR